MTEPLATLRKFQGRYELIYPEMGLIIRGHYPEWVMEAAAEVIAEVEKRRKDGEMEEVAVLVEMGEMQPIELDSLKYEGKARFEIVPQCLVSLGDLDYRWISPAGKSDGEDHPNSRLKRVHDMSATRNDTFLQNEPTT